MKALLFLILGFFLASTGVSQSSPEALELIRAVNTRFNKVKDYTADARIETRISFLNILPQRATVYYKKPDKFRLKSKGIAVLPKQDFSALFKLTSDEKSFVAYTTGKEVIRQRLVTAVNVIPVADTGDLVLAKIWIDQERSLVLRSQLTTRANGTVLIDYEFGSLSEYALPDRTTFTIEVKKFKIPRAVSADINAKSKTVPPGKEPKTGQIEILFSNYVLNKGLPDTVFRD